MDHFWQFFSNLDPDGQYFKNIYIWNQRKSSHLLGGCSYQKTHTYRETVDFLCAALWLFAGGEKEKTKIQDGRMWQKSVGDWGHGKEFYTTV